VAHPGEERERRISSAREMRTSSATSHWRARTRFRLAVAPGRPDVTSR